MRIVNSLKALVKNSIHRILKYNGRVLSIILFVITFSILSFRFQLSFIKGESMSLTLENRQLVLINKQKLPNRYDIVTFEKDDQLLIKRIIGMPGDRVIKSDNRIMVEIAESNFNVTYTLEVTSEVANMLNKFEQIPSGYYFVMGDNVTNSNDSRYIGLVSENEIYGLLTIVIF